MTTTIQLQTLFYDVFLYYFNNNRNTTKEEEIKKYIYFLGKINTYLINIQKNKTPETLTNLYNQWTLDQLHIRNYIIRVIKDFYIPKINSLTCFYYYHTEFYKNFSSFMKIFNPFEKTLEYYASILERSTLQLSALVKYQWENSFTEDQFIHIANREIDNFPQISTHIPLFLDTTHSNVFKKVYIKGIDTKIKELVRDNSKILENVDKDVTVIRKIEFLWDTHQMFETDLCLYKQYFNTEYDNLYNSFVTELFKKKFDKEYDLYVSILDTFFTIQWWNTNNRLQEKWIELSKKHEKELGWEFISIQYYEFLKNHFYYKTHTLTREITHKDYFYFLINITTETFPFTHINIPKSILTYFYSSISRFIIEYWKENIQELVFIYLSILRNEKVILQKHLITLHHLFQTFKDNFSENEFILKYDTLFQKRILELFYNSEEISYPLLHYIEFERDVIKQIESLPNANNWFHHKSRWNKMLNEIQESDNFTNTVSLVDNSILPINVFIGTYGFYTNIEKSFGMKEAHFLENDWKQIESFYPVLHEKQNLKLLYNLSNVEFQFDNKKLICSMDVANTLVKWQNIWDKGQEIQLDSLFNFEKMILDVLEKHGILQKNVNKIEICDEEVNDDPLEILLFQKDTEVVEKKEKIKIRILEEQQYYQSSIIRYCKMKKTTNETDLWNYVSTYICKIGINEPNEELFKKALDKLIDGEYIEKMNHVETSIVEYVYI